MLLLDASLCRWRQRSVRRACLYIYRIIINYNYNYINESKNEKKKKTEFRIFLKTTTKMSETIYINNIYVETHASLPNKSTHSGT